MINKGKTLAIMGHRGIPAKYGGFETMAEKITPLMVERGFAVTNYCRKHLYREKPSKYLGSKLVYAPALRLKVAETISHTFFSILHLLFHPAKSVIMFNVGNAPIAWIPRLFGMKVILCVDALEWERKKWGKAAKAYLKLCARLATITPSVTVTDAKAIQDYYSSEFGKDTVMIPYGADFTEPVDPQELEKFKLKPRGYFLYVSRFEPENNPLLVRQEYEKVQTDMPLVMVGNAPYADEYIKQVKSTKDERVNFLGYVFGKDYKLLQQNAYAYVRASEVGGTPPALVEAMGYGNCIIYNDTPGNTEVVGEAGIVYSLADGGLAEKLNDIARNPQRAEQLRKQAVERAKHAYSWEIIADSYANLCR